MDLPSNRQVMFFPIVRKRLIPGRLQNNCTHDFWNPVSFPGTSDDSFFIFNAEELEMKDD
jgi:hypothetical protein